MGRVKAFYHDEITKGQRLSATRWFRANQMTIKLQGAKVDSKSGVIKGVSVCTEGEALGHDVWLDSDFIADVSRFGNEKNRGLKARFGHPSMSGEALGTFIGRFKTFRVEGNKAVADLYLDESAKNTPNGNLYDYILELASNPDVFGASIVFSIDSYFFKKTTGEKISSSEHYKNQDNGTVDYSLELDSYGYPKYYVKMKELYGADLVDEPAANPEGLFSELSSINLHSDKFAVIATQFFNTYPQIAEFVQDNPHKLLEFMAKFSKTPKAGKKPLDEDEDDLLLKKGKKALKADDKNDEEGITDEEADDESDASDDSDAQDTEGAEDTDSKDNKDNEALLSAISKMMDKKLSKRFKSIEDRLSSLEENPTADPTFSKKEKDNDKSPDKTTKYSWQLEWEKRYGK